MFASYFTDILFGAEPSALKIICIIATAIGLVFIASLSNDGKVNYKQIIILLILYIVSKFAYGLVINLKSCLLLFHRVVPNTIDCLP